MTAEAYAVLAARADTEQLNAAAVAAIPKVKILCIPLSSPPLSKRFDNDGR